MNAFVFAVMGAFKGKLDKPARAPAEAPAPSQPPAADSPAPTQDAKDKTPRT